MNPFSKVLEHTFYTSPLGNNPRVLDIGANHGVFAREMRQRFNADIVLVEANPVLFERLAREGTSRVQHCAVTATEGMIPFHVAKNDQGSSILTLPADSVYDCTLESIVAVRSRTLTSILEELGWDRVHLIKMDIEGAEVEVLNSISPETLARVDQFSVEFHSDPVFRFDLHGQTEKCLRRMEQLGFHVIDFSHKHRMDVLLLNRKTICLPFRRRFAWRLRYDPPKLVYQCFRMIPKEVRKPFVRWYTSHFVAVHSVESAGQST